MGEHDAPEPIEVELTSHAAPRTSGPSRPSRRQRRRRDETSSTATTSTASPQAAAERAAVLARRHPAVTVAVVATVALAAGWMLGRSTGGGAGPVDDSLATRPGTTAPVDDESTLDTISPVDDPPISPPTSPPTTASPTTAPASDGGTGGAGGTPQATYLTTVSRSEVFPAIAGQPIEIVALASGRRVVTIDLSSGTTIERRIDRQPFGPAVVHAGPGWIVLPTFSADEASRLVRDGAFVPDSVDLGPAQQLLPSADTFWRLDKGAASGGAGSAFEVTHEGSPTGVRIEVPAPPSFVDPAGGLVVHAEGGVYRVTADATTRLTTGRLIAIAPDLLVTYECDAGLACEHALVDRATGDRTPVPVADGVQLHPPPAGAVGALSPDRATLVASWFEPDRPGVSRFGFVDVATGELTELVADNDPEVAWTPDSGFLLRLSGGRLVASDRATGDSEVVTDDVIAIEAFTTRPVVPEPGDGDERAETDAEGSEPASSVLAEEPVES